MSQAMVSGRATSWSASTSRARTVHATVHRSPLGFNTKLSRPSTVARSTGSDVVDGWLDVAKLVTSAGNSNKTAYDGLASSIGKDIYVDIGGWHLYLRDLNAAPGAKMSQALAVKFGPQASDRVKESDVESVLKQIPVKLGGGKTQVSLLEVMPSGCVRDLSRILEDYARDKK